jgi:hypothetical protein
MEPALISASLEAAQLPEAQLQSSGPACQQAAECDIILVLEAHALMCAQAFQQGLAVSLQNNGPLST